MQNGDAALTGLGPTGMHSNAFSQLLTAPLPQQQASRGAPPIGSVVKAKSKVRQHPLKLPPAELASLAIR